MKSINSPNNFDWGKDIIKDLSFIKKHKRYPFTKRTIPPSVLITILVIVLARIAWPLFFGITIGKTPTVMFLSAFIAIMAVVVVLQYLKQLRFSSIKSEQNLSENIQSLRKFLRDQNLAFTQHNDAPEVFLIISKNLNANPKKEYREVMVFIADDNRILVNSHFVGSRFSITPPSGNYRKMAKNLEKWLTNHINKNNKSIVNVK